MCCVFDIIRSKERVYRDFCIELNIVRVIVLFVYVRDGVNCNGYVIGWEIK